MNLLTNKLGGWAEDFNGNFSAGGNTYGGLLFVKPGAAGSAKYWSPGIEFGIGATPAPSATGPTAAMVLLPQATGNSQSSQGILMQSTNSGGSAQNHWFYTTNFGDLLFNSDGNPNPSGLTFAIGYGGLISYKRDKCAFGSQAVAADFALSAGWGNTATIGTVRGQDCRVMINVTANGAGIAVNPNIAYTYHDGTWGTVPLVEVTRCDANSPQTGNRWVYSATATVATIFFLDTPVAGNTYCAVIDSVGAN